MKNIFIICLAMMVSTSTASAHEMVPTYPSLVPSHLDNVYKATMEMFNKRSDVEYYEIGVFDVNFQPIPFVSKYTVINIRYLGHVTFDVYIRKEDVSRAEYICSKSKLRKQGEQPKTAVSSRICSKFK